MRALAERETGREQGAFEAGACGHADAPVVEERAVSAARGEQFVAQRVVDDRVDRVAMLDEADRYAKMRDSTQVIVRAVERVDDPGALALAARPAFLGEDRVARKRTAQFAYDFRFRLPVDFGNEVHALLLDHGQATESIHVAQHDLAGIARRAYRNIDGWSGHRGSVIGDARLARCGAVRSPPAPSRAGGEGSRSPVAAKPETCQDSV